MRSHQYFCECGVTLASVFLCKVLIIVICIFLVFSLCLAGIVSCLFDCMNFDCSFGISVDFSQKSIANKANLFVCILFGNIITGVLHYVSAKGRKPGIYR